MNHYRSATVFVSPLMVGCMFGTAYFGHIPPSEAHLITSAPLTTTAGSTVSNVDFVHHDTTIERVYTASVPAEAELRFGSLTTPST
jgi:hypothetical protein